MTQHRATPPIPMDPLPRHHHPPAPPDVYGAPQPGISVEQLKGDIQQLIVAEKREFARNPLDTSKQTRLKALLDLQTLIQRPDMPPDQLMLVRDRVAELAVNMRAAAAAAPALIPLYTHTPTPTPPVVVSQQPTPVPLVAVARPQPPPAPAVPAAPVMAAAAAAATTAGAGGSLTLDALFGQGALAKLLSARSATPIAAGIASSSTPQPQSFTPNGAAPAAIPPPPQPSASAPPAIGAGAATSSLASNPSALLAMLRQSGLIRPEVGGSNAGTSVSAAPSATPGVYSSLTGPGGRGQQAALRFARLKQ